MMLRHIFFALVAGCVLLSCTPDKRTIERELHTMAATRQINPQRISRWLTHTDPLIRQKSIETLGAFQDTTWRPSLEKALQDADAGVRGAAIFALGQLFNAQAEAPLLTQLETETDTANRVLIIRALGKSGSETAANALLTLLTSEEAGMPGEAALALGVMAYRGVLPPDIPPHLSALLAGEDPESAWKAAYALYRLGALRSFDDLDKAIRAPRPLTRFFALKGVQRMIQLIKAPQFQEIKGEDGYRQIYQRFVSRDFRDRLAGRLQDDTWYVQVAALQSLQLLNDDNYQGDMLKLVDHIHPQVALTALQSAARFKNRTTEREMERLLAGDADWRIKGEALVALATIAPAKALKHVQQQGIAAPWPQNYYAIVALDSLNSRNPARPLAEEAEATRLLVQLANSDNVAQATLALEALIGRNNPPAIDYFKEKLAAGDVAQTTIIASYFAQLEPPRPVALAAPLMTAYQAFEAPRDLEAMTAIIAAIDSLHSDSAKTFLEAQLASPYAAIQNSARNALKNLTGSEAIELPDVKNAAALRTDFRPLSPDSGYVAAVKTSAGSFKMRLLPDRAPVNAANFAHLSRSGYFNGILFHRVVPAFVTQGGDPRGDGWGGPGYAIPCEYNDVLYNRGTVGMALSGKDTGGSQWFVAHTPQPHLDGRYTVFGEISEGMETVDRIRKFDVIESVTIAAEKSR